MAETRPAAAAGGAPGAPSAQRTGGFWKSSLLAPLEYFLGALCFIAGAACQVASQPRTGADTNSEGAFLAATILYIMCVARLRLMPVLASIAAAATGDVWVPHATRFLRCSGSSIFIGAAFLSVLGAHGEAKLLRIGGRIPGIARLLILTAWGELIGSLLILIGSSLSVGVTNTLSAGTILWLIGSWVFLVSMMALMTIALIVGSVTALMPEMIHRQRAWFSIGSQFFFTVGWIFFTIGAAAQVVLYGPGFLLFAGLNWLVAASLWFFAFIVRICGAWYYRVPILSFATAAAATSSLVAGTDMQAGVMPGTAIAGAASAGAMPVAGVPKADTQTALVAAPTSTVDVLGAPPVVQAAAV